MELSTPDQAGSPLKKHKLSRESIGEAFSFTPTRSKTETAL